MRKTYRIKVTTPTGKTALHPIVYTSRKKAQEMAQKWNEAQPTGGKK